MREASGLWVELVIWRDDWRSVWIRPGVLSWISSSTFLTPEWPVGNWDTMIPVSVIQICTCTSIIEVSIRSNLVLIHILLVNIQITIIPSQVKFYWPIHVHVQFCVLSQDVDGSNSIFMYIKLVKRLCQLSKFYICIIISYSK